MATMNISLPDRMKEWVEGQTQTGRFANASDYVRDLIRQDQDRAAKLNAMQRLIDEGLASGRPEPVDAADFLAALRRRDGV